MAKPDPNRESAERILDSAVHLFARKGYAATSVREIVEAACITKPTLYYHFGSKDGICRAAFTRIVDLLASCTEAALAGPNDARDRLIDVVWCFFRVRVEYPDLAYLAIALLHGPETEVPRFVARDMYDRLDHCFDLAAERACSDGLAGPEVQQRLARGLRGTIVSWVVRPAYREAPELSRDHARQVVDDLLCGFAVRGAGGPCAG